MKCSKCACENTSDAKFCERCGSLLEKPQFCRYCGASISSNPDYCPKCGLNLNGKPIDNSSNDASVIPDNYRRVTGNIYAVLNEHGVVVGYKERRMKDEKYIWVDTAEHEIRTGSRQTSVGGKEPEVGKDEPSPTIPQIPNGGGQGGTTSTQYGSDGTYTQTETLITTETAGGRAGFAQDEYG